VGAWRIYETRNAPDIVGKIVDPQKIHTKYLFGSRIEHNPSYVWHSTFMLKMVAKQGERWG